MPVSFGSRIVYKSKILAKYSFPAAVGLSFVLEIRSVAKRVLRGGEAKLSWSAYSPMFGYWALKTLAVKRNALLLMNILVYLKKVNQFNSNSIL